MISCNIRFRVLRYVLVSMSCMVGLVAAAQLAGEVDTEFNAEDIGNRAGYHIGGIAMDLEVQPDGRVLCLLRGNGMYGSQVTGAVFRLFPDGTLDPSFSTVAGFAPYPMLRSITLQPDGKMLVCGSQFTEFVGFPCHDLVRLHADGTFDPSFQSPTVTFPGSIYDSTVLPDGKILIVGTFESVNGMVHDGIARLFPDGTLDGSFQCAELGANAFIQTVHLEETGSLLIGGRFTTIGDHACGSLARLHPDGAVDATVSFPRFNQYDYSAGGVTNIAVLSDGRIAVSGGFDRVDSTLQESAALLLPTGAVDETFEVGAAFHSNCCATSGIKGMVVDADDRLYFVGNFTEAQGYTASGIIRLLPNGAPDPLFNFGLGVNYGYQPDVSAVALASNGGVIAVGDINTYGNIVTGDIVHVLENGDPDLAFDPGTGANSTVQALARQEDGKLLVGGTFSHFNGEYRLYLARLHADGTLDQTFHPPAWSHGSVRSIEVLTDGRILCGGSFDEIGVDQERVGLVRLNADGSLDNTFQTYSHPSISILDIVVQQDGKITIAGWMNQYHDAPRSLITRLLPDGELDESFTTAPGGFTDQGVVLFPDDGPFVFGPYIESILLQPDGKTLVAGVFSTYGGEERVRIARLNVDGSNDLSFDAGTYFTSTNPFTGPQEISIDALGNITVAGYFDNAGSSDRDDIVRLTSNGQIDPTFDAELVTYGLEDFVKLDDESIVITGRTQPGVTGMNVRRLLPNGHVDPGFRTEVWNSGAGNNGYSNCLLDDMNGGVVLGGTFTAFDGIGKNNLVRIFLPDLSTSVERAQEPTSGAIYPNPLLGGLLHFDLGSNSATRAVVRNATGAITLDTRFPERTLAGTIDASGITSGIYSISFIGAGVPRTYRLVIAE